MNIAPIRFSGVKAAKISANKTNIVSFQAKKDSFEKSKPTAKEANSALETLAKFFGLDMSVLCADNFDNILKNTNPNFDKYTTEYQGIKLLNSNNISNKNQTKYDKALKDIENTAFEKLSTKPTLEKITKQNPTLWSLTSEFAPIKEGGLGVVPPAIAKNAQKAGVGVSTFIPMYLQEGFSTLLKEGNSYTYTYKNEEFPLKKVMQFDMDIFQNGEQKSVPVEIFSGEKDGNNLIFVKCANFFDGSIYESNLKTQEPEKFAIFSKAVYDFTKLKTDTTGTLKNLEIVDNEALDKINEPDGVIINDWQASPYAALLRYKAPLENACSYISDEACDKLKNMNVITIGHNVQYQGLIYDSSEIQRKNNNTNILNTLFDKFAYDIVKNAKTGSENFNLKTKKAAKEISNVLLLKAENKKENYVNPLNMGIVLSDYFCPVSKNYSNELISKKHKDLSYDLQDILIQKAKAGRIKGIINGNDFNTLSIEAKHKQIENQTGLDFATYSKNDDIKDILDAKKENKTKLYNDFILPFSKSPFSSEEEIEKVAKLTKKLENIQAPSDLPLKTLSKEEIENTPIFTSGGRLVSQKGVDILCDSLKELFENWEKDFPNQNKPIVYIAGADGEGGKYRKLIEEFKNSLGENSSRVIFAHGFAPIPAMMAGSDFFLMTSKFEPCGLTQSESLALATPVIATSVGGLVDTVNRNDKENGILTPKNNPIDKEEYYQAIKKGLNIFFNDKKQYSKMVQDSIQEDFSWIQENNQGPVFDYLNLIGIETN